MSLREPCLSDDQQASMGLPDEYVEVQNSQMYMKNSHMYAACVHLLRVAVGHRRWEQARPSWLQSVLSLQETLWQPR